MPAGGEEQIIDRNSPARLESESEFVWRVTQVLRQVLADGDQHLVHDQSLSSLTDEGRRLPLRSRHR
jgi:hypothetical protein